MAIVQTQTNESKDGVRKTIDKNSMGMALDILQRGLYAFPIKSTVRELASNAHDAIKERDVAKAILNGEDTIEAHFDTSLGENGIYHASGWDPDYFDLGWLSDDPKVKIYYEEGALRDTLRIVDNGVGLGKDRLLGYFKLNYSSKRANKDTLGRFGLGSKVPLSLGIESFRVINKYNGMKFKFDVYLDKVESVIPVFGTKGKNERVQLTEDKWEEDPVTHERILVQPAYYAYWEPTTDKNGVEVIVEVKKHNKNAFFEAIESQLMYMPNIEFLFKSTTTVVPEVIDIAADIKYRDDDIIISRSTVYNRPHILLGTGNVLINYGYISFQDLEIEPKGGAVGLIMDINEVEVTPARESLIWSTRTRDAVLEKYGKVTETAAKYVNQEVQKETDYLKWIQKSTSIISSIKNGTSDSNSVLSILASIIDIGNVSNLKFAPDPTIVLKNNVEDMFGKGFYIRAIRYERWEHKVKRDLVKDLQLLNLPLFYSKIGANKYKDRYLYEEHGKFTLITEKEDADIFSRYKMIAESTAFTDYDAIEVPEERLELYLSDTRDNDDDDEDSSLPNTTTTIDHKAVRKLNKQIVVHHAYNNGAYEWVFSTQDTYISDIFAINPNSLVLYGTGNDRPHLKAIMGMLPKAMTTRKKRSDNLFTFGMVDKLYNLPKRDDSDASAKNAPDISSILVARENLKYIAATPRFVTPYQLLIKGYDKRRKKLVVSKLFQTLITAHMVFALLEAPSIKITEKYGSSRFFRVLDGSQDMYGLANDDEELTIFKFLSELVNEQHNMSSMLPSSETLDYLVNLGKYQLIKEGRVSVSEEEEKNLHEIINDTIPDFMCDFIDEVDEVEAYDAELLDNTIALSNKLLNAWGFIALFDSKYFYDHKVMHIYAADIKEYLLLKNPKSDEESV